MGEERLLARRADKHEVPRHPRRKDAVTLKAFLGDPAVKADILDRVRAGWEARKIIPIAYLKWTNGGQFASLSGTVGKTQDPDAFVASTGLTVELALLCETLINAGITFESEETAPMGFAMQGDEAIWSFGTQWLEAIDVDQDVSDTVTRFMPVFLTHILAEDFAVSEMVSPAVREAANKILNLWACEARGEAVPAKVWRQARASALRASDESRGLEGYAAADLVESLPWPSDGIAAEFPSICRKFLLSYQQALAAGLMTSQERMAWGASLEAERQLTQLRSEPQYSVMSEEELQGLFPELKQAILAVQTPAAAERIELAMQQARAEMVPFLRQQMDGILQLLKDKPD